MKLTFAEATSTGPARHYNEDAIAFWVPQEEKDRRIHGAIAAIADGDGGYSCGEIASRLVVDTAISIFKDALPGAGPNALLARIFEFANSDLYNFRLASEQHRMAATLSVSIIRNNEVTIGHVGDCRIYLLRNTEIVQLTTDHVYTGIPAIGVELADKHEPPPTPSAALGQMPKIQVEFSKANLQSRDCLIQCSDGLYNRFLDHEISRALNRLGPADACRQLVRLAEDREADDNISIQVIAVE